MVEEPIQKSDSVITLRHKTEENTVMQMDLLMKNPKVVTAELALVYKSFYFESSINKLFKIYKLQLY